MRRLAGRKTAALLILLGLVGALGSRKRREELLEKLKDGSDSLVNGALRATSRFGSELTGERADEQTAFRRRRLRDLR